MARTGFGSVAKARASMLFVTVSADSVPSSAASSACHAIAISPLLNSTGNLALTNALGSLPAVNPNGRGLCAAPVKSSKRIDARPTAAPLCAITPIRRPR